MFPIEIPAAAKAGRPECDVVSMGPPPGVSGDDCGTAQMLIQRRGSGSIPGYAGRAQYAYYQPSEAELEQLANGGFIEVCQYGQVVQPFSAAIWGAPAAAVGEERS